MVRVRVRVSSTLLSVLTLILVTRLCTMSGTKLLPIEIEGSSDEEHRRNEFSTTRTNKEEEMARQCTSDLVLAKVSGLK